MPKYEYDCSRCGPFSDFRPMADYERPAICHSCTIEAPRASVSVPAISTRSARASREGTASASRFSASSGHGAGCGCCGDLKIPRKEWIKKLM
jgi:putative FmdB family regulatory protein